MGKKNKGGLDGTRLLLGGYDREMERFGVKGMQMGGRASQMSGNDYRSEKDVEKDMVNAARNDYDLRRTLEAAAMSGKGKAEKILDKGFKNAGDITNALNFSEKAAKRHGQGGDFSSASDYMGLTQSMVERDRRKQTESYDNKYATNDALAEMKEKMLDAAKNKKQDAPVEYTESDEFAAAKERLNGSEYDTSSSIFNLGLNDTRRETATTSFRKENEAPPASDDQARATNSYLDQYKHDVIKGGQIGEARTDNIANAFNTVIGSDI